MKFTRINQKEFSAWYAKMAKETSARLKKRK